MANPIKIIKNGIINENPTFLIDIHSESLSIEAYRISLRKSEYDD